MDCSRQKLDLLRRDDKSRAKARTLYDGIKMKPLGRVRIEFENVRNLAESDETNVDKGEYNGNYSIGTVCKNERNLHFQT